MTLVFTGWDGIRTRIPNNRGPMIEMRRRSEWNAIFRLWIFYSHSTFTSAARTTTRVRYVFVFSSYSLHVSKVSQGFSSCLNTDVSLAPTNILVCTSNTYFCPNAWTMTLSPNLSLLKLTNGPGSPLARYTWLVSTLFPFQDGNALPCNHPAW